MDELVDFLYLDLPRLWSFASQLLGGIPTSTTDVRDKQAEFGAGIEGGLPSLLRGQGNTKAVLSASSSVTSTVHHELVSRLLDTLSKRNLLHEPDPGSALRGEEGLGDGAFVLLRGQLQLVDPTGLARTMRLLGPMLRAATDLQQTDASPTPQTAQPPLSKQSARIQQRETEAAKRRQQQAATAQQKQFTTVAEVAEALGGETVRVRILQDGTSLGTAVVERDKFVESLDRLVLRHGYVTGGSWRVFGQVNIPPETEFFQPDQGGNLMDMLETGGVAALQQMASLTAGSRERIITPLSIHRPIPTAGG